MNIMLVDDDKDVSEILENYLSLNFDLKKFNNPVKPLKYYKVHQDFLAVIVGFNLYDFGGKNLIEKFHDLNPDQPIIITSCTNRFVSDSLLKLNKQHLLVLEKPFLLGELDKILTDLMP